MSLTLSPYDQALLNGESGPAAQMAMSIILRMAKVYGAATLLDITQAHIDSTIYVGPAGLEFAERLAKLGARVVVPTTLNVSGVDEHNWQAWAVPPDWAHPAIRQMAAFASMGCTPTWTCAPYQTSSRPHLGQQIAWGESNAIAFANSVLGARTERYPDLLDICCAITGRVPAVGLHLKENRAGQVLVRLRDVPLAVQQYATFYPILGYWLGQVARDRVPVIEGLSVRPSDNQFKALGAAAASSGTVALFHVVGVTPEAPTREAAFQGHAPQQTVNLTLETLRDAYRALTTATDRTLDMVVLGCPHFSLVEFEHLARLVAGKQTHPDVRFLITTSRAMRQRAAKTGALAALQAFGGKVAVDTCVLASPMLPSKVNALMTHSAKCAYYAPGMLKTAVTFGSTEDCVRSAVAGRVVKETVPWQS